VNILAEVGVNGDQAIAAAIGIAVTAIFNLLKNTLMTPGTIKQIEKENVMRDAKLDKLFEKTDRMEKQILLLEHKNGE
jgi:L-cystine uptake protein TcyP (sodium:dicarboxylate symporter family)